jgi:hypothetical protein
VSPRERLAEWRIALADWWFRYSPQGHSRRMDAIYAEVVRLDCQVRFLVKTLENVVSDERQRCPDVTPLKAIKGSGCRSAPRRPGLHLVKEADR